MLATTHNAVVDAWDFLTKTPGLESPRNHRLKGELATVTHAGRTRERWQHELPGGARIWFFIDEQAVHLVREQRLDCGELTLDILIRVHEHHAVARLLEPALGSIQGGRVAGARDIRGDAAPREGRLGAPGAGGGRRRRDSGGRVAALRGGAAAGPGGVPAGTNLIASRDKPDCVTGQT